MGTAKVTPSCSVCLCLDPLPPDGLVQGMVGKPYEQQVARVWECGSSESPFHPFLAPSVGLPIAERGQGHSWHTQGMQSWTHGMLGPPRHHAASLDCYTDVGGLGGQWRLKGPPWAE